MYFCTQISFGLSLLVFHNLFLLLSMYIENCLLQNQKKTQLTTFRIMCRWRTAVVVVHRFHNPKIKSTSRD
jgi:hypothetical protein